MKSEYAKQVERIRELFYYPFACQSVVDAHGQCLRGQSWRECEPARAAMDDCIEVGAMNCSVALTLLSAHGFRTATAEEMWPYRGIKSKGGGLIYAGGPFTCESAARGHKAV